MGARQVSQNQSIYLSIFISCLIYKNLAPLQKGKDLSLGTKLSSDLICNIIQTIEIFT